MRHVLLFLGLNLATAAAEPSVVGDWRGSGGSVFHIPASSGRFQLKRTDGQGKSQVFQANWEKPGERFEWVDAQQARHKTELDTHYKELRFRDVGESFPDSPAYWYKK